MLPALLFSSLSLAAAGGYGGYATAYGSGGGYGSSVDYGRSSYGYDNYVRPSGGIRLSPASYDSYTPRTIYRSPYRAPAAYDSYSVADQLRTSYLDPVRYAPPVDSYAVKDAVRAEIAREDALRYAPVVDRYAVKDAVRYAGVKAEYARPVEYVEPVRYAPPVVESTYAAPVGDYSYGTRSSYAALRNTIYRDAYRKAYSEALSSYATPVVTRPVVSAYDVPRYSPAGRSLGEYGIYMPSGGYARSPLAKSYDRPVLARPVIDRPILAAGGYRDAVYRDAAYRDASIKIADGAGTVGYYGSAPRVTIAPYAPTVVLPEALPSSIPTPVPPPPPMPAVTAAPYTDRLSVTPVYRDEFALPPASTVAPVFSTDYLGEDSGVFQGSRAAFSSDSGAETFVKSSTKTPVIAEVSDTEVQDFMQGLKDMEKSPSRQ